MRIICDGRRGHTISPLLSLKPDPKARARLAATLLKSLEELSDEESAQLWAEEAARFREHEDEIRAAWKKHFGR